MTQPKSIWNCPKCNAEVDAGFDVCWACGTSYDGTLDPNFAVATAPIVEVDHAEPPSPWAALLLLVFFPALVIYGMVKLAFPLRERRLQSVIRPLILVAFLVFIGFLLYKFVARL